MYVISPDIKQKIRQIQLRTQRILHGSLVGDHRTAQKGFGLEFEQLAEYQFGDDIRFIDWKSSARTNKLLIKEYREEKKRTIMLIVDGSQSNFFGSTSQLKYNQIAEIASILALATHHHKDHVGLIMVTDVIEQYIPPRNSISHVNNIMEFLFSFNSPSRKTSLAAGLKHLMKVKKNNTLVFLISDFIDEGFDQDLAIVSKNHDLVAIRCRDTFERQVPSIGIIECIDPETGEHIALSTNTKQLKIILEAYEKKLQGLLKKNMIPLLDIVPGNQYIDSLISFLIKRTRM
jgi:uncharacterized protein (DUF58 family)